MGWAMYSDIHYGQFLKKNCKADWYSQSAVISAALCSLLDHCKWGLAASTILVAEDPISGLGEVF